MTRIASSMINSNALTDLQRAQRELFDAQRKTATQREAEDLKGYGSDARTVVSLDRMRAQAEAYKASAEELTTRLDLQDAHIGRAADVVGTLREKLTNALALGDLSSVGSDISAAFSDLKSSFNATLNGKYMFGGNLPTEAPIVADSISDLANNPLADAVNSDASAVQGVYSWKSGSSRSFSRLRVLRTCRFQSGFRRLELGPRDMRGLQRRSC